MLPVLVSVCVCVCVFVLVRGLYMSVVCTGQFECVPRFSVSYRETVAVAIDLAHLQT